MDIFSEAYAQQCDSEDPLAYLRKEFVIPSKADLKRRSNSAEPSSRFEERSTYLCGNSLGLQPVNTGIYFREYLQTWATKGVYGHFTKVMGSPLVPWLNTDEDAKPDMAKLVGARPEEVAVMQTLTGNLHLAMCSFYRPTKERYKIIIEGKAFPSDHFAIESQIRNHDLDPKQAMVLLVPNTPMRPVLSTRHILRVIDENADSTALLLLPGVQFYTGQFFDIATITAHAQKKGIVVGWDLAHAVGNVPLELHDWNVDFAAWCSYKYLNCGPGAIGGLFIHERHGKVTTSEKGQLEYRPRLAGWWGSHKTSRFTMDNSFAPIPGAAGWQLSNPSTADMTAVRASLDIFKQTTMQDLRKKSLKLTKYLEDLLRAISGNDLSQEDQEAFEDVVKVEKGTFEIITPSDPRQRGAQLSIKLAPGMLDEVMKVLEESSVVVDERKPDVIRVAPAPLYNNYGDVLRFVTVFRDACKQAAAFRQRRASSVSEGRPVMVAGGQDSKGWSDIK